MNVIQSLPGQHFRVLPSMRFSHFSELLRNSSAIIGNSSTGVREAPFLGIPSLDVGTRQTNRCVLQSVHSVCAEDRIAIDTFLRDAWGKRFAPSREFGEGCAANNFLLVLNDPNFWARPFQKHFNDAVLSAA